MRCPPYWRMVKQTLKEIKFIAQLISLVRGQARIQTKAVQLPAHPHKQVALGTVANQPQKQDGSLDVPVLWSCLFHHSALSSGPEGSPLRAMEVVGPSILTWTVLLLHLHGDCSLNSFSGNTLCPLQLWGVRHPLLGLIRREEVSPSICYLHAHFGRCPAVSPTKCQLVYAFFDDISRVSST